MRGVIHLASIERGHEVVRHLIFFKKEADFIEAFCGALCCWRVMHPTFTERTGHWERTGPFACDPCFEVYFKRYMPTMEDARNYVIGHDCFHKGQTLWETAHTEFSIRWLWEQRYRKWMEEDDMGKHVHVLFRDPHIQDLLKKATTL